MIRRAVFMMTIAAALLSLTSAGFAARTPTVAPGDRVTGELERSDPQLDDDCYYDEYVIEAEVGTLLVITQTSSDIDPYLIVLAPDGRQWDNDDMASGTLNASLSVMINRRGQFRVLATSYAPQTGRYVLSVEEKQPADFYGIFVGIEDYPEDWPEAPLCDEDAESLYETFVDRGLMQRRNGIVLTNEDATRAALTQAFTQMSRDVGPEDVFVFFFSGHGTQIEMARDDRAGELDGMDEAICLIDGEMSDNEFSQMLNRIDSALTVVVLDACNSGGFSRDVVDRPKRVLLASSEEDVLSDFAPELEAGGYLSAFFREAIEGEADLDGDGIIMMGELAGYLEERFNEDVPEPEVALQGYQELVHDRGAVTQDTIFFWFTDRRGGRSKDR